MCSKPHPLILHPLVAFWHPVLGDGHVSPVAASG